MSDTILSWKLLDLIAYWNRPPQTLAEFADACALYLKLLQPLHPMFREGLYLLGDSLKTSEPLALDGANIEAFVNKDGWDRESPWKPAPLDERGELTFNSVGYDGFMFTVGNLNSKAKNNLQIRFTSTGSNPHNYGRGGLLMGFPYQGVPAFYEYDFLRHVVSVTVDYWKPEAARVNRYAFQDKVEGQSRAARHTIGWLNYIRRPGVCAAVPADVKCEPFGPEGGALITLQREPVSADDAQAVARAVRVRDALLPGGWLEFEAVQDKSAVGTSIA
jgi:Immunity protein 52